MFQMLIFRIRSCSVDSVEPFSIFRLKVYSNLLKIVGKNYEDSLSNATATSSMQNDNATTAAKTNAVK